MFHGLLIVLIPIGLIWALIVFPALRIAVVIFMLVVCAIAYGIIETENKNVAKQSEKAIAAAAVKEKEAEAHRQRVQKAEEARWSLVKTDQVQIRDASLKSKGGETFDAALSVHNGSTMRVNAVEATVTLYDCYSNPSLTKKLPNKQNCEIIGETNYIFKASIPPSQTRGLQAELRFANLPQAKGSSTFNIAVTRVKANANPKSTEFDDTVEELDAIFGSNE
jgi:uncharacterized membrane protein